MSTRESWGTKLGVVMAVAGSAVGLGNFLRFPAKATLNGGGAFLIPYFVALLLLGIPLMWVEWTLGRKGGELGHGTAPSIFHKLSNKTWLKYVGAIGVAGPFVILIYYMFVESWALAYAWYSFTGVLFENPTQESMKAFLTGFQGLANNQYFSGIGTAYTFFVITFLANFYFIYRGVKGGIEKLSLYGMPILIVIGVLLVVRVFTLGTPDPAQPDLNVGNALGFVWNPDFSKLTNAKVWLEAAGQIFFTLSVGIGCILTYASYLKRQDDVTLSGLAAASTNEFCEVILGGSIVIPAAFVFLGGASGAMAVAQSGTFNIGFVSIPLIFQKLPMGALFCGLWFILLFIAGITSSVSLIEPAMSFFQDELKVSRKKSAGVLAVIAFVLCQPAIFFLGHGFVDELDFWGGTMFLVLFALVEVVLFAWIYGLDKGWADMHEGAQIKVPYYYKFIIKYVSPLFIMAMLVSFFYQNYETVILMKGVGAADRPYIWGARALIVGLLVALGVVLWHLPTLHREGEPK